MSSWSFDHNNCGQEYDARAGSPYMDKAAPTQGVGGAALPPPPPLHTHTCQFRASRIFPAPTAAATVLQPPPHAAQQLCQPLPTGCTSVRCTTVRILIICGILSFALGVLNFILAKFCGNT